MSLLGEKFKEVMTSTIPIVLLVAFLAIFVLKLPMDQILIFLSPRIGSSVIRICPSGHTSFIPIIKGGCPGPGHLYYNGLTENSRVIALICRIRS